MTGAEGAEEVGGVCPAVAPAEMEVAGNMEIVYIVAVEQVVEVDTVVQDTGVAVVVVTPAEANTDDTADTVVAFAAVYTARMTVDSGHNLGIGMFADLYRACETA